MDPIPAKDALSILLATDALLIAVSTVAASIGHSPRPNSPRTNAPARAAGAVAWLMVAVSSGALSAWIELYVSDAGIDNVYGAFQSFALLAALVAIPIIGFAIAKWAK